ncbi:MAG: prolipoprotein diacylglyceryl transferase [Acidobacteria bacterium]|nr:prolipoprotein diacylglyceryl transferase [Acidobacteriota bacterium]
MPIVERMRSRWGVGPVGVVAILAAFALAGTTTLWVKEPVMGYLLPAVAPGWLQWTIYLIIMLPIYQALLLAYGTLLGQFDFFWSKMRAMGRLISRSVAGA